MPNDEPLYINRNSNHSPTILSRLPQTIRKRISSQSSNYELFTKAAPMYNAALENAGYAERVNYDSKINENIQQEAAYATSFGTIVHTTKVYLLT